MLKNAIRGLLNAAVVGAALATASSHAGGTAEVTANVTQGTVIENVTAIDTRDGSLRRGMTLALDGGEIVRIATPGVVLADDGALLIDASGKYVVPGYLDMHTPAMVAADRQPTYWPLLIANGVTGIREMAGSAAMIQRVRQINADSAAGRVDAPEILAFPGEILASIATPEHGAQRVRQQQAIGADFIKMVSGSRAGALAVLDVAR